MWTWFFPHLISIVLVTHHLGQAMMPAKSSPFDEIPTSVIKMCANVFASLKARLVMLSFSEGEFPVEYKHALVTPLLKNGLDTDCLGNYRLISNLRTISKIVERVYMSRRTAHVRISPNYSRFQSVYRCGHSTKTALLRVLNDVYCAADNKYWTTLHRTAAQPIFTLDTSTLLRRLRFTYDISGRLHGTSLNVRTPNATSPNVKSPNVILPTVVISPNVTSPNVKFPNVISLNVNIVVISL